jgi:hypothetical protein
MFFLLKGNESRPSLSRMTGAASLSGSILPALSSSSGSVVSHCRNHHHLHQEQEEEEDDIASGSTTRSSSMASTISGSGLLFLKNYLSKKKQQKAASQGRQSAKREAKHMTLFNSTPMPFPPPQNRYGPLFVRENDEDDGGGGGDESSSSASRSSRRLSLCSTVADLLNEDFDCDDSELKNLDWEEWDEPLPGDFTYDDLVSVISESFYSDELDLAELCDLDMEGRKTVVASEAEVLQSSSQGGSRSCSGQDSFSPDNDDSPNLGSTPVIKQEEVINCRMSKYTEEEGKADKLKLRNSAGKQENCSKPAAEANQHDQPVRSKYGSYHTSSTFMQDLEAELELPPMSPVTDEKEEAVRAISRTISRYMRTRSDGSCSSEAAGSTAPVVRQQQLPYSRTNSNSSSGGDGGGSASSRHSMYVRLGQHSNRNGNSNKMEDFSRGLSRNSTYEPSRRPEGSSRRNAYEDYGRDSRLSVASSLSDYLPELAASPTSPAPFRRPLSQLLICDLPASSPGFSSPEQCSRPEDGLLLPHSPWREVSSGRSPGLVRSPPSGSSGLTPQQISEILSLPRSECTLSFDNLPGYAASSPPTPETHPHSSGHLEVWPRARGDSFSSTGKPSLVKNANRDSLLCSGSGNCSFTPPQSGSPILAAAASSAGGGLTFPLMRHSSCNSTDSGCPLIEDKNASPSPPPPVAVGASPRMSHIEVLSSNRNKLASFWEKTLNNSNNTNLAGSDGSGSVWIATANRGQQPLLSSSRHYTHHQGFQPPPARPGVFGSDTNLGSGGSSSERLAHFLDVTRRAAEKRGRMTTESGQNYLHHRASTGSDCADFMLKPELRSPGEQRRRRDSYTEYFV